MSVTIANSVEEDVKKAIALIKIDEQECIEFTSELLVRSQDSKNQFGCVKSNFILGYVKKRQGDFGKAILYYLEGIRYAQVAEYDGASTDLVRLLQNTGTIFKKFGHYQSAKKYYSDGMDIALELNDFEQYTDLIYLTARVLREEERYDEAIALLETSFEHFPKISKSLIAEIYNQLGLIHSRNGSHPEAFENFNKLLTLVKSDESIGNTYRSWAYHNLGDMYFKWKKFDSAVFFYQEAIDFKLSIEAKDESLFRSYKGMSEALIELRRFERAEVNLKEAEKLYSNSKNVEGYYEIYKLLSLTEKSKNNLEGYITYQDLYSISLENYLAEQRQIEAADKKYNLDLITQRYFALVAEQNRNQQIQYYSAVGGSFLVTLIVLIIAFFQYRKYRLRKDLEASLKPYIKDTL